MSQQEMVQGDRVSHLDWNKKSFEFGKPSCPLNLNSQMDLDSDWAFLLLDAPLLVNIFSKNNE